ncbi:MAG: ABC transporter, partial [Mycobacterium sp.]
SRIVQYDTPEEILARPANDFVRGFVGAGAALKQLTLTRVRDVELHDAAVVHVGDEPVEAIRAARAIDRQHVIVLDAQDRPLRWLSVDELAHVDSLEHVTRNEQLEKVSLASTLNNALDDMLTSSHGVVVVTGRRGTYQGVIRVETIMDAIAELRRTAEMSGSAS